MSVCLNCMREFKAGKNTSGRFCSHQCFCAYEHSNASVNGQGVGRMNSKANWSIKNKSYEKSFVKEENFVKRNLGEVLDSEEFMHHSAERFSVGFNDELSDSTIQKLNSVLLLCRKKKLEYGIV